MPPVGAALALNETRTAQKLRLNLMRNPGTPKAPMAKFVPNTQGNPIADVPNWQTGGRQAPNPWMSNSTTPYYIIGGALLIAAVLMRRRGKKE